MGGIAVADENEKGQVGGQVESTPVEAPAQEVFPVASEVTVDNSSMATANTLVTQSGNTYMTAGTCSVIDELVRQFCGTNPSDISCQFQ